MNRKFKQGKRVLSLVVAMVMVLGVFSVTALAADKPLDTAESYDKAVAKYEKLLNEFEDAQPPSAEGGVLNSESFNGTFYTEASYEIPIQDFYETEDNDDFSTADVINKSYAGIPTYAVLGQIDGDSYDEDTYKFSVTASGTLDIWGYWVGDYYDQGLETEMLLQLYDSSHNLISSALCFMTEDGWIYRGLFEDLSEGTYYLKTSLNYSHPNMLIGEEYCLLMDYYTDYPSVSYQSHVQNIGWQDWCSNGGASGTSGQSLRLEAMRISLGYWDSTSGIEYQTHVQNIGWQDWVSDGELTGTSGQSLRLEAIKIRLTGDIADDYDVYYRVHAQNVGWMGWAKNGASSGTAGYSYRLEAIEIKLVEKGDPAPGTTANAFMDANASAQPSNPVQPSEPEPQVNVPSTEHSVKYQTHVQNVGWQGWKSDGEMAGTSGQSLRLEGMYIEIDGEDNAIEYRTHVQNIGWQDWVRDGAMTGTSGQALRLEAIDIRLTGDMSSRYDIYYRVHAQNFGWMGWAKNGQSARLVSRIGLKRYRLSWSKKAETRRAVQPTRLYKNNVSIRGWHLLAPFLLH